MSSIRKLRIVIVFVMFSVFAFSLSAEAKLTNQDAHDVWNKVAKATDLTSLPFDIKQEKVPNAWVTNGQSVTVTTGLLNLLETKSELYGVFAHEAGHAKLNHHGNTVSKRTGLAIGAAILSNVLGSGIADVAVGVGSNLAAAGWSREQEVAADDYAVKLAHENKEDIVGLYSAMQRLSTYGGKLEPSGFNSHPPDDRRLLHIKNEILKYDPAAVFPEPPKSKEGGKTDGQSSSKDSGVELQPGVK